MKTLQLLLSLLLPQDTRLAHLLRLSAGDMRRLLPKAKIVGEKDAYNLFDYGNKAVRKIVWSIKYKANPEMISRIASYIYEEMFALAEDEILFDGIHKITVVPISSNRTRMREKGFNQCEMLLKAVEKISKNSNENFFDFRCGLLQKTKDTPKQAGLKREERLQNVKNSMQSSALPAGSVVFVIDDVYTTGATFDEARRALLDAGAKKVFGFFVAH